MKPFVIGAALLACSTSLAAGQDPKVDVAKRFAHAVKGDAGFVETDFVRAPSPEEQAQLKTLYSECRSRYPRRVLGESMNDTLVILWDCPDVDSGTPLAISLVFDRNEIAQVRLHNTDLRNHTQG